MAPTTSAASFLTEEHHWPNSPPQLFNPIAMWHKKKKMSRAAIASTS